MTAKRKINYSKITITIILIIIQVMLILIKMIALLIKIKVRFLLEDSKIDLMPIYEFYFFYINITFFKV